jgi:hypothetical protein
VKQFLQTALVWQEQNTSSYSRILAHDNFFLMIANESASRRKKNVVDPEENGMMKRGANDLIWEVCNNLMLKNLMLVTSLH